jgi:hypothetical protein
MAANLMTNFNICLAGGLFFAHKPFVAALWNKYVTA